MKKKLAIFALGSCLSLGTAAICAAQTDQNTNPNQTTTTQSQTTTTNGQNDANNPNNPNYNPNSATNPNANPNYKTTNPNATNPNVTNPNATGKANRMPATDANWLGMLLGGGGLSFLGMRLRKFARR